MNKYIVFLVVGCLGVVNATVFAQDDSNSSGNKSSRKSSSSSIEKAEELYDNLAYKAAIPIFNQEEDLSLLQMVQLATAYRLNHDTENAEIWYAQIVAQSDDPEYQYYYAQALQSNGREKLAKVYFKKYDKAKGDKDRRGELFATSIGSKVKHENIAIRNERAINTSHLDFSPSFYKGSVVFVSTRSANILDKKEDKWIKDNFMSLFIANKEEDTGLLSDPDVFALSLNTTFHEGPVTFNRSGRKIFFTRNTFNKGKRKNDTKGIMRLNIYESSFEGGEWSEAKELGWNTDDYEEAHPSLSYDGQTLYFSSNRPGGHGGMDLYYSKLINGKWGDPVNLGPTVNTAGTEAFPFSAADGKLYFASDGHGGKGGLDVFYISRDSQDFTKPENIGTPFNSEKDDFGFIINATNSLGYFASARLGGKGGDDIYSFVSDEGSAIGLEQTICVYESPDVTQLIKGAKVKVTSLASRRSFGAVSDGDSSTFTTADDGTVSFPVEAGAHYEVQVSNLGYANNSIKLDIPVNAQVGNEVCIPIHKGISTHESSMRIVGKTYNSSLDKPLPDVELTLTDIITGERSQAISSPNGTFSFGCIPCGRDFIIEGYKKYFDGAEEFLTTASADCKLSSCSSGNQINVDLVLVTFHDRLNRANSRNDLLGDTGSQQAVDIGNLNARDLKPGSRIALRNIYYDFNEHVIRSDAQNDLNNVVSLMLEYPSMEIELGSHTDSRASVEYNWALAQRRAESARQYLVEKGVDIRRITARGYGESELRNRCADFVKCSEAEHQLNRRTEVKIIRMDGNVGVDHLDANLSGSASTRRIPR